MSGRAWTNAVTVAVVASVSVACVAQSQESILTQPYDLGRGRVLSAQHYEMETEIITRASDGSRAKVETFEMRVTGVPGDSSLGETDTWTCHWFALTTADGARVTIPALARWSYGFDRRVAIDEHGQVLGIPHAVFEGLTDDSGRDLPPLTAYQVYNQFVQFHAYVDQIATPGIGGGNGIQRLASIGDRIILDAPADDLPLSVGLMIKEGSVYKPGRVTLEFKGLSVANGRPCALIGVDGGEGSYVMVTEAMPTADARTLGGTRFFGDVCVDLASMWLQRAEITVVDVTETSLGGSVVANTTLESHYRITATPDGGAR